MGRVGWAGGGDFRRAAPEAGGSTQARGGAGRREPSGHPARGPPLASGACGREQPKGRLLRSLSDPGEGLRKVARCAGSSLASRERRGLDSSAHRLRQRFVAFGARPVGASRSAVASLKPAALGWADDRNGKGAHGVGAAQGQVPLGQHVGRVSQQAQPLPGARQCGLLQPTSSQLCVASSRGQQPPESESPAGERCGPHAPELSPPPHLLFLFVVLSLLGLRCRRGRLPWLPDCEPSKVPDVQRVRFAPCPLLSRRNGFSSEGSL